MYIYTYNVLCKGYLKLQFKFGAATSCKSIYINVFFQTCITCV